MHISNVNIIGPDNPVMMPALSWEGSPARLSPQLYISHHHWSGQQRLRADLYQKRNLNPTRDQRRSIPKQNFMKKGRNIKNTCLSLEDFFLSIQSISVCLTLGALFLKTAESDKLISCKSKICSKSLMCKIRKDWNLQKSMKKSPFFHRYSHSSAKRLILKENIRNTLTIIMVIAAQ